MNADASPIIRIGNHLQFWKLNPSPFLGLDMLSQGFTWHAHRGVAMRQDTDTPTLIAGRIAISCRLLVNRIHERFPNRGIDAHANKLADYAERLIRSGSRSISAPVVLRIVSWVGGIAAGLLLISPVYFVRRMDGIDVLPEYLQSLDACITVLAATVAGFFTMRSIEHGVIRRKALRGLHVLRSYAHVTDMLQISKSPTRLLFPMIPTKSTLLEEETVMSMSRYLCYCGELYAMIAKLAAIYGEWTSDGEVLSAIDDVEGLCSSFENKTMQKILLLEQLSHRVRSSSRNIRFKPQSFHFTRRPLFPCGSFENDFGLFQGEGYERSLGMICFRDFRLGGESAGCGLVELVLPSHLYSGGCLPLAWNVIMS